MCAHGTIASEWAPGVAVAGVREGVIFHLVIPRLHQLKDGSIAVDRTLTHSGSCISSFRAFCYCNYYSNNNGGITAAAVVSSSYICGGNEWKKDETDVNRSFYLPKIRFLGENGKRVRESFVHVCMPYIFWLVSKITYGPSNDMYLKVSVWLLDVYIDYKYW